MAFCRQRFCVFLQFPLWLFFKAFPSPLTVQNRCRCWPAPRTLLLYHDSTIPRGHSRAKVENDFNPQQYLCCSQSSISPKELILFAVFLIFHFSLCWEYVVHCILMIYRVLSPSPTPSQHCHLLILQTEEKQKRQKSVQKIWDKQINRNLTRK